MPRAAAFTSSAAPSTASSSSETANRRSRFGAILELGASFATAPDLRIWKIRLPWLAGGYQFGETVS